MWRCECGCVDRIERKYTPQVLKRGKGGEKPVLEEGTTAVDVSWRPRQAMPLQSLGKAQVYHVWIICSECQRLWDCFLTSHELWKQSRETEKKVNRLEIEGHGNVLATEWEHARDELYNLQAKVRDLAREWADKRKAEVAEMNKAAGVETYPW